MDRIKGDRRLGRWRRGLWSNRRGRRLFGRNSRVGFLRMTNLRSQRNDRAKNDEPSEKHEKRSAAENLGLCSRGDLQRKQGQRIDRKRAKITRENESKSNGLSRHNPQFWQLSCSNRRMPYSV